MQVGNRFKEVYLPVRVVNGLKDLNGDDKRDNVSKDKMFVKALLVGLFGVKAIKDGDVDKYVVRFIKGEFKCLFLFPHYFQEQPFIKFTELFSYRVEGNDENGTRYIGFKKLCDTALTEIREDIYTKKRI